MPVEVALVDAVGALVVGVGAERLGASRERALGSVEETEGMAPEAGAPPVVSSPGEGRMVEEPRPEGPPWVAPEPCAGKSMFMVSMMKG